jgi:hypothetical protein
MNPKPLYGSAREVVKHPAFYLWIVDILNGICRLKLFQLGHHAQNVLVPRATFLAVGFHATTRQRPTFEAGG